MLRSSLAPLRRRAYATFWSGAMVSDLGTWVQLATVGTLVTQATGSAASAGLVAAATFGPQGIGAPLGGVLADRFDRRRLFLTTLAIQTVVTIVLAIVIGRGERNPNVLSLLILVQSASGSTGSPSMQSILPELVPPNEMLAASSLGLMGWNLGRVLGPLIAAALTPIGPAWAIGANAISFLVLWCGIAAIRRPFRAADRERHSVLGDLKSGFRATLQVKGCLFAIAAAASLHLLIIPFMGFAPVFAQRLRGAAASSDAIQRSTSLLLSAQGIGAVLGGLCVTWAARRLGRSAAMRASLMATCGLLIAYVYAPRMAFALPAVLALGGTMAMVQSMMIATNQQHTPPEHRGRILSWWQGIVSINYGLGLWLHGRIADRFSLRTTLTVAAVSVFLGGWLVTSRRPSWRRLVDYPSDGALNPSAR